MCMAPSAGWGSGVWGGIVDCNQLRAKTDPILGHKGSLCWCLSRFHWCKRKSSTGQVPQLVWCSRLRSDGPQAPVKFHPLTGWWWNWHLWNFTLWQADDETGLAGNSSIDYWCNTSWMCFLAETFPECVFLVKHFLNVFSNYLVHHSLWINC